MDEAIQARRVRKRRAAELPSRLDEARLLDMVPDLDREQGLGRVLREVIAATQSNFDAVNGELKRAVTDHNDHADETNAIKEEVLSHDHPKFGTKSVSGFDQLSIDLNGESGMWITPTNFGGGDLDPAGVDGYDVPTMVPVYIDKPCTIHRLRFEVYATASGAQQDVKLFIYAGDYDGNWPDTLIYDGTGSPVLCASTGPKESGDIDVEVGAGWYWLGLCTTRSDSVTDLGIKSWDNGWNHAPINQSFWPFPQEVWALDTGFDYYVSAISAFGFDLRDVPGPADPLPGSAAAAFSSYMDDWVNNQFLTSPFYNSYAPIIEYRVN